MTRSQAQRVHANRRAQERFGCTPSGQFYRKLVEKIKRHDWHRLTANARYRRTLLCQITVNGETAVVVYDRKTNMVRTFLTPDMVEQIDLVLCG